MDKFLVAARETEGTTEKSLTLADYLLRTKRGGVWFVIDENKLVGYCMAELTKDLYQQKICFVHQLYIDQFHRGAWVPIREKLEPWARENGARHTYFSTRRDPAAFKRMLGKRCELDACVMRVSLFA